MIRIGILSDTHGWLDKKVWRHFESCDQIWHAGDIGSTAIIEELAQFKPLKAVYGNIDDQNVRSMCPEDQRFVCGGLHVWITHIGGNPSLYHPRIRTGLAKQIPDLFVCGHSHILRVMHDPKHKPLLYLNPGAAGKHGFHHMRTLLRFEIVEGKVCHLEAIELGVRGQLT
ncbi:MAG: metallophosphatase family protein [Amoebophilaceae bacterium]|nr:metallophosphatase family protein [Amoebophilaceae bacterium]